MHMQYKDCGLTVGLSEEFHAILKSYRKYTTHGTSLNRSKQWEISLVFSYIGIKGKIKIKSSGFSRRLHSVFCNS